MKCTFIAVLGFYLVLGTASALADPANIAGDTYRLTNYYAPDVPEAVDIELVFNDEFMDRLGSGDQDMSLLGIEYSIYYNHPVAGTLEMQTGDISSFAPVGFYIEYDASGNPLLMRLDSGYWKLYADFSSATANIQDALGYNVSLSMELLVDGEPYDDARPVEVDAETLELQQTVVDYYYGVVTEDNPNQLRTLVHMQAITQLIEELRAARVALREQLPSQP